MAPLLQSLILRQARANDRGILRYACPRTPRAGLVRDVEIVPDLIDPIVGWRAWRLRDRQLYGVHYPVRWWPDSPLMAACGSNKDHSAPGEGCTCGIHATKDEESLRLNYLFGFPDVYGTVSLWGRVTIHSRGYRAEFGYPRELYVADEGIGQDLMMMYGVSVVIL